MKQVNIFDIQRCSMVDGPGIRTTVFFKGCDLHCAWCHNPESQSASPVMMFYRQKCVGCGKCREVCPNHLVSCDLCGRCVDHCPHSAREICGKLLSTEDILSEILKDRAYYDRSGGGATFSGGECMLQIDALEELLFLCCANKINTAVDTAGAVAWERFERIYSSVDWFLYDVKCWNSKTHERYTGISNQLILENLRHLAAIDPNKIIVRIPVIPGVNTSEEEMTGIASLLKECGIHKVELLPYHKMGEHKYSDMGLTAQSFEVPDASTTDRFRMLIGE